MTTCDPSRVAEAYENRLYPYDPTHRTLRWWALKDRIHQAYIASVEAFVARRRP